MALVIKPITSTPRKNPDIEAERALEREIEAAEAAKKNDMFPGYKPSFTSQTPSSPMIPWSIILLGVAIFFMWENK